MFLPVGTSQHNRVWGCVAGALISVSNLPRNHLEELLGALKCKFQKKSVQGIEQSSDSGNDR